MYSSQAFLPQPLLANNFFQELFWPINPEDFISTRLFLGLVQWLDPNTLESTWGIFAINARDRNNKSILFIAKDDSHEESFRILGQDYQQTHFFTGGSYYRFSAARHLIRQAQADINWNFTTFSPAQCKEFFEHVVEEINIELSQLNPQLPFFWQQTTPDLAYFEELMLELD